MSKRRVLRILGVGVGIAVLLVGAAILFLQSSTAKRLAFERVQKVLRDNGVIFEGANFEYSLLDLRISIDHPSIVKASTPDLPKVFAADHLTASINLAELIGGRYRINDLIITNPNIQIAVDARGRNNIPEPPASQKPSTGSQIDWLILKMRATGGSLTVDDRSRNLFVRAPDWKLDVDGNTLTATEEIVLKSAKAGDVKYNGKDLTVQDADLHLAFNQRTSKLDIHDSRVASDVLEVAFSGTVNQVDDPVLDLKTSSVVHLKPARTFLEITQKLDGDLNVDAAVSGRPNQLKVTGHVNGESLTAETINQIAVSSDFTYDAAGNRVQLKSMQGRFPGLSMRGNGDLALVAKAGESKTDIRIDAADLEQISRILKLPVSIAARASGRASAQWPAMDFDRANGNGNLQLTSLKTAGRRANDPRIPSVPVDGAIGFNARGGNIIVSTESVHSDALQISGQLTLRSSKVDGAIRVDTTDVGQAVNQIAKLSGSEPPPELHLSGAAGADLALGGTLKRPDVVATLVATQLQINDLKNIDLNAVAEYTPDLVDVRNIGLQWEGESLTGNGKIGLHGPSPSLDAALEMSNASIPRILAAMGAKEIPATGIVSIAATVTGTIEKPVAVVNVSASNLQAYDEPFGTLSAAARIDDRVVQLDRLSLNKEQSGPFMATGNYDTTSGKYSVKLEGNELKLNHLKLPQGPTIGATVNVTTAGDGTTANPSGSIRLAVKDLQVDNENLGSVDVAADVADHRATVKASAPAYGISADGTVATLRPYLADFEIHANDADIARIPSDQLKELSGKITAVIRGSGNLEDPRNAQARATVQSLNLSWRNHAISSDGPIGLQYSNREVTILDAAVRMDESTLKLSGNFPVEPNSFGQIDVEGKSNLADLSGLIPSASPVKVQGQLAFNGRVRGNLKWVDPDIAITVTGGSFESSALPAPLTGVGLRATAKDGRLLVNQLDGDWAGAKISVQGEAPFSWLPTLPIDLPRPPGASRLSVDIQHFKLSALVQPPENADGTLSMKVEAEASHPELDSVVAKVTVSELKLNAGPYALGQVGESSVELQNSVVTVRQFELSGPQTELKLVGNADLRDKGPVDLKLAGATNVAVLALFSNTVRATGSTAIDIAATGTVRQPVLNGFVELHNGQAVIKNPRIAAENVEMRLDLNGSQVHITRLDGLVNGGALTGDGDLNLFGSGNAARSAQLNLSGEGVYFEFPKGVRTVSNGLLILNGDIQHMTLTGGVDILEGTYTDSLTLDLGLMRYLQSEQNTITVEDEKNPLRKTQLNIGFRTISPLVVNNNIGRGDINMEFRLLGTIEHPGLTGRIDVEEGAELRLRERKYSVDRGVITFINDRAIEPVLDIEATTKVSPYDITIQITGDATRKIDTVMTSDPSLPEEDIIWVLATGKTKQEVGEQGVAVARDQVLSYVAGELGTAQTERFGRALGLDQVRIDPSVIEREGEGDAGLIAGEAEPTARLTIGKDITRQLNFVYSMNLRNSNDQIWIADYDITRRFSTRGIRQNDNSFRLQFQHELLFGIVDETQKHPTTVVRRKIGSIQFSGETHMTDQQLLNAVGLRAGSRYDFFSLQNGRRRLEEAFAKANRLEAQISVDRKIDNLNVDLTFRIKEGPTVEMVFDGGTVSENLKKQIRTVWSDGVIDAQRIADATELIEVQFVQDGYLGSKVECVIETPDADTEKVLFRIQPGSRFDNVPVEFVGVQAIQEVDLRKLLKDNGVFDRDLEKRKQVVPLIERFYRDRGYIDIKVEQPRDEVNADANRARTVIRITEGPVYHFGPVAASNYHEFSETEVLNQISFKPGEFYEADRIQKAQQDLQELYRKKGYDDVTVQYTQVKDVAKQTVAVSFDIQENLQRILRQVDIENNLKTSKGLIRSELELEPGDIVSYEKLSQARINLYNTGAYSFVEIVAEPSDDQTGIKPNQTGVRLRVKVRELAPWQVKYGGFYDTEHGPGGIVDISNHNMIGNARTLGLQTRYDSQLREIRLYLTQPSIRRFPVKGLLSAFKRREIVEYTDEKGTLVKSTLIHTIGFSPTFEYRYRKLNVITFGYRFENVHSLETLIATGTSLETHARIAGLTSSIRRDTRDDPIDATKGRFHSHSLDWSSSILGSQVRSIKYFGQYFTYFPLTKPTEVPWAGVTRSRVVAALGARIGLAKGLGGQGIFKTERFLAGGGTTVRGFEQNKLGPLDLTGTPLGGNAMLVLNAELRFPLYKFVDGVTFVDAGNVYSDVSAFKITGLRETTGVGLRLRTPYLVLRADYGRKVSPKPGEVRGKFFFSIGQTF